jgi:hypothetical protein
MPYLLPPTRMLTRAVNERLWHKFLDLKEDTLLISLKLFSALGVRITARNTHEMNVIFDVRERRYRLVWVRRRRVRRHRPY